MNHKPLWTPISSPIILLIMNMNSLKKLGINSSYLIRQKDFWKNKGLVHMFIWTILNIKKEF